MRLTYIITKGDGGGSQRHVLELIRAFIASHEIALVTGEPGFLADQATALGAEVFIVPDLIRAVNPSRDIRALLAIMRIIRKHRPDIIHAHCSKAGLLGRIAAAFAGVPCVYNPHGLRFAPGVPVRERLWAIPGEWLGARFGGVLIAIAQSERDLALRYRILADDRIESVPLGIPDCDLRAAPASGQDVIVTMVGRFVPQKDHSTVVRAFVGLSDRAKLWLIGDGNTRPEIQAQVVELGLAGRVQFWGNRSDVNTLLAASHVFVLASHYEGLPTVLLEAMRAGLPVVVTDAGGVRDCVISGNTGFVVPQKDPMSMRAALAKLVEQPQLRALLGAAGRKLFESHFSTEQMVARTRELYARATGVPIPAAERAAGAAG